MWKGGLPFQHRFDYSYDGFMRSYEQSLMRLGINTVDALVIHDLDSLFHQEEIGHHKRSLVTSGIKALEELKRRGEISAIGMGVNTKEAFETIAPIVDLDFVLVAMPYTLIDQASLHTGMAECVKRGVSVLIGSPFASGILVSDSGAAAKYAYADAPEDVRRRVQRNRGGLPNPQREAPRCGIAVCSRTPGRRCRDSRSGKTQRGRTECRVLYGANPGRLLGGSQIARAHR